MSRRRFTVLASLTSVAGLLGVFLLPWFVPVGDQPVLSEAYAVGYSNPAAVVATALACIGLFALAWRRQRGEVQERLWSHGEARPHKATVVTAVVVAGVSTAGMVGLWWLTTGVAYGESLYFLSRAALVAAGYHPFTDFSYGYALVGVYGPAWLWQAFGGSGLSPLNAYWIVYLVLNLLSWLALFIFVDRLDLADRRRAILVACLGAGILVNETVGIQYTLIRYLSPAVALIVLHVLFTSRKTGRRLNAWAVGPAAVVMLALVAVAASSEMVLVTFVACGAYLVWMVRAERRRSAIVLATYTAGTLLGLLLVPGYFGLVIAFGRGGLNFPVLPGPFALVYLASAGLCAVLLPRALRVAERPDAALTFGMAVLALTLVPAALGRDDLGHLFFNGLVLFVLTAALLARRRPWAFVPYVLVVAVVFGLGHVNFVVRWYSPDLLSAFAVAGRLDDRELDLISGAFAAIGGEDQQSQDAHDIYQSHADLTAPRLGGAADLAALSRFRRVALPFAASGTTTTSWLPFVLAREGMLYSNGPAADGFTVGDQMATLEHLRGADCVLIQQGSGMSALVENPDPTAFAVTNRHVVYGGTEYGTLMMCPLQFAQRRPQFDPAGMLALWLHGNYKLAFAVQGYDVYVRRDDAGAAGASLTASKPGSAVAPTAPPSSSLRP